MTILTNEIVEKAARVIYPVIQENTGCIADEKECSACMLVARVAARACLEAALPDVVEKCAQIAEGELTREGRYRNDVGSRQRNWVIDGSSPYGNGRLDSADAIRSLLNKEDGNG